ncbi:choline dehydrogenase [Phlyctema vagabunda]|uniref:Choline dehydrogenase n=1 Tax=Phlyctema vagabunda TaxID=108571 RepID=A0ABR4PTZ0_9HELO
MGLLQHSLLAASSLFSLAVGAPFHGRVINRDAELAANYDFVIVGGGTAGLAVANRLSEDSSTTVLVIEAGLMDEQEIYITSPGYGAGLSTAFIKNAVGTKYDWNISYAPQPDLNNRSVSIPIGKVVGGGSVLNRMAYDRGSKGDYDRWVDFGNPGWDWDGLLPYFKKAENASAPSDELREKWGVEFDYDAHGHDGYLQASYPPFVWPWTDNYIRAMKELDVHLPPDGANGNAIGAFWNMQSLTHESHVRSSSRNAYYDTVKTRANLHLLTSSHVTKLITKRSYGGVMVTGVEYSTLGNTTTTVSANKEVILSAGAFHTPQVLQLSGIGEASLLSKYGIKQVIDLPGVGEHLQDHQSIYIWTDLNTLTVLNYTADPVLNAAAFAEYEQNRTGPYATGSGNFNAFLPLGNFTNANTTSYISELAAAQLDPYEFYPKNTAPSVIAGYTAQMDILKKGLTASNLAPMEFVFSHTRVVPTLQHPLSRGSVKINSTNALVKPIVDCGWLTNPIDVLVLKEAVKYGRSVMQTEAFAELNPKETIPGSHVQSEEEIEFFVRNELTTLFHPSGTAAMMKREIGGVVDPSLKVYGTTNLRVVDTSIIPLLPSAHTQGTVYAIAEKASDIIKAAHGLL